MGEFLYSETLTWRRPKVSFFSSNISQYVKEIIKKHLLHALYPNTMWPTYKKLSNF